MIYASSNPISSFLTYILSQTDRPTNPATKLTYVTVIKLLMIYSDYLPMLILFGLCVVPILFSLLLTFYLTAMLIDRGEKGRITVKKDWCHNFINGFVDTFLLCKIDFCGYRNKPNANLRLMSTFVVSIIIGIVCFVATSALNQLELFFVTGTDADPRSEKLITLGIASVGLWLGLFWKEKKDLHDKWHYLAVLYNEFIQQAPTQAKGQQYSSRNSLRVSLANDLLLMGMWAHNSFYPLFECALVEAYLFDQNGLDNLEWNYTFALKNLIASGISEKTANDLLQKYHSYVVELEKTEYITLNKPDSFQAFNSRQIS